MMLTIDELEKLDILGKIEKLDEISQELLALRLKYAEESAALADTKANLEVLKQVKGALQTSIRAELKHDE